MIDGYSSHLPILECIFASVNPSRVLEFGAGKYSTPFFKAHAASVLTCESNVQWLEPGMMPLDDDHAVSFAAQMCHHCDLIFIDNSHLLRWQLANECQKNTGIIVLHDSEERIYNYDKIVLRQGWRAVDICDFMPWTLVLSSNPALIDTLLSAYETVIRYKNLAGKVYIR